MKANFDITALATLTRQFALHKNWSVNTASLRASGKGTFIADLVDGRVGLTIKRRDRIIDWYDKNWPADLEWPRDIPRPSAKRRAA